MRDTHNTTQQEQKVRIEKKKKEIIEITMYNILLVDD